MIKMSALNEDQCPAQCDEKYKQTQNVVGLHKRMVEMMSAAINETDNLIQGMSNSEFNGELTKYKDISSLARKLSNVFTKIPWAKREISKMLAKWMEMEADEDREENSYPRPGPDPRPFPPGPGRRPFPPGPGPRPSQNDLKYSLPDESRSNYRNTFSCTENMFRYYKGIFWYISYIYELCYSAQKWPILYSTIQWYGHVLLG